MVALSMLHDAGVHVILRLWPYIPDLAGNLESLLMAAKDALRLNTCAMGSV